MYQQQPCVIWTPIFNTSRPRQNGRDFADDIFKCMFLNGNVWISLKISRKFVPMFRINNIPAFVQIMAWRRPGDKPLSEPMMFSLLTYICVTRPQWVNPCHGTADYFVLPGLWLPLVTRSRLLHPLAAMTGDFPSQPACDLGLSVAPNSWDNHHNTICCCFVSNNNHIFAIPWLIIK